MHIPSRSTLVSPSRFFRGARWATALAAGVLAALVVMPTNANDLVSSYRKVHAFSFQQGFGTTDQAFDTLESGAWGSTASAMISSAVQSSSVEPNAISASTSTSASGSGVFGMNSSSDNTLAVTINVTVASSIAIAGSGSVFGNSFNFSAAGSGSLTLSGPGGPLFAWSKSANGHPSSPNWSGSFEGTVEVPAGTYSITFNSSCAAGSGGAGSSSSSGTNLTFTVDVTPALPPGLYVPSEYATIAAALSAAQDGEIIYIAPGVYNEHGLTLTKKVSLMPSAGAGDVIIDGGGLSPGILFINGSQGPETLIKGITFRNSGGGTPIPFAPQFDGGGAILINGASPRIESCSFISNRAGYGAAVYTISSAAEFTDCTFESNVAFNDGGALQALNSPLTLTQCAFLSNSATGLGGALHCPFGSGPLGQVTVNDCEFRGNAAALGGAMTFDTAPPLRKLVVTASVVECNLAVSGGAFWSTMPYANTIELADTKVCSNGDPQFVGEPILDAGGNTICGCRGDLDADGTVGPADLSILLGDWGGIDSDLNCDGVVGSTDLAIVLGSWGPC